MMKPNSNRNKNQKCNVKLRETMNKQEEIMNLNKNNNTTPRCKVCNKELIKGIDFIEDEYCIDCCFKEIFKKPHIKRCDICNNETSNYAEVDGKKYCSLQCAEEDNIDIDAQVEEKVFKSATTDLEAAEYVLFNIMNNPSYFRQNKRLMRSGRVESIIKCYCEKKKLDDRTSKLIRLEILDLLGKVSFK